MTEKVSRADQLQTILDSGDEDACLRFFSHATEHERRELSKTALAAYQRFRRSARHNGAISPSQLCTAQIAALATGTLAEVKKLGWRAIPEQPIALEVLDARQPAWLTEFAEWLIAENVRLWPLVRTLVRRGLCDRPQHDHYIFGMMLALNGFSRNDLIGTNGGSLVDNLRRDPELLTSEVWELFRREGQGELTLAAHDKYIGTKRPDYCWNLGLKELAKTGELSRDLLLDESLQALQRGFSQIRVAWFSQFHELLEPTTEERLQRQEQYLRLLASPIPPTVAFALNALDVIDRVQPLAADAMIAALEPLLTAKHKMVAMRAVQWLDRLASREPNCKTQASSAACRALIHSATDVQRAAIEVLEKHGSSEDALLKKQAAQTAGEVAASLRKRLRVWLGSETPEPQPSKQTVLSGKSRGGLAELEKQIAALPSEFSERAGIPPLIAAAKAGRAEISALHFGPLEVPRLHPAAVLAPFSDLDEWIDVCAYFLEAPEQIDEGERVLDGLSRLCTQDPADSELARQLGPLQKRIEKVYRGYCGPFLGMSLRDDVCGVVRAWISGQVVTAKCKKGSASSSAWAFADKDGKVWGGMADAPALWMLSQRSLELAQRVAQRQVRPLLSAPTHRGGWLDPLAYVQRLRAWHQLGEHPPHHDAIVALLRLAPDNRAAALGQLSGMKGEMAEAARYALGGSKPKIGGTAALWIAAARARNPLADDPVVEKHFPGLGPGAGKAAQFAWKFRPETYRYGGRTYHSCRYCIEVAPKLPANVPSDLPSVLMNRLLRDSSPGDAAHVRWNASLWPAGRESHLSRGTRLLANNIDWSEAEWGNKAYLEPLVDGDEPLGELARLALCLGLSAKEPGEHTLAADVLIAAIQDGRVDGQCLVSTLATLLTTAGVKPARWGKVLGDVARVSPLHAHVVRQTLENVLGLAGDSLASGPKELHHLLELLLELIVESGSSITNPSTREALSHITTGSGKAKKAAQALLAVKKEDDRSVLDDVVLLAIQGRLERARRWAASKSNPD